MPEPTTKPTVYILHGDDEFAIKGFVETLYARMGDPGMADLNTTRLDGRSASGEDLRTAAMAIPFLAERRLVVLTNPLAKINTPEGQAEFKTFLNGLPETTALVLVIEDTYDYKRGWKSLSEKHWLIGWAQKAGAKALVNSFLLPQGPEMARWILKKSKELGGQFEADAAATLASGLGNDTRVAALEIDKLLTYVDRKRAVTARDVDLLTTQTAQVSIFELVDAVAKGQKQQALRLYHRLLEDEDADRIFAMILRQFRLVLQAREVLDEGGGREAISQELGLAPFVAGKLLDQAPHFSMAKLEAIYHRLLEIDEAQKTSQIPLDLALDELIVGLGN